MTRPQKFTKVAREHFLAVLRDTASPSRAAEAVGISRVWAYATREKDLQFRADWDAAVDLALDRLVEEGFRRAVDGIDEPVVQGGHIVCRRDPETGEEHPVSIRRYSDRLLECMIKWRYPDKMAERLRADVKIEGLGLAPEALLKMSGAERRALIALLTKYRDAGNG
jgi:hypothetical protein